MDGHSLIIATFLLLFASLIAAAHHDRVQLTCGQVCEYDRVSQKADCSRRNLTFVPSSKGCEDSRILKLDSNHIKELSPESFLGYNHLENLYISDNDLSVINAGTFNKSRHLQVLVLSHNNINCALNSSTFTGTESLQKIYLNNNTIQDIDKDAFLGLSQLQRLHLSHNKLRSLPETVFHGTYELQHLTLDNNILEAISSQTFENLTHLRSLSLLKNKLTELPYGLFGGLSSLEEIFLSHNELHKLPPIPMLGINHSLDLFSLNHNNFTTCETIVTYLYTADKQLAIGGNPFRCDCFFSYLQMWNLHQNHAPDNFLGRSVMCSREDVQYGLDDLLPFDCSDLTPYPPTTPKTTSSTKSPQTDGSECLTTQTMNNNESGFKTSVWFIFFFILFFLCSVICTLILIILAVAARRGKCFLCRENHTTK